MLRVKTNLDGQTYGDSKITQIITGNIMPGSLVLLNGESDSGKSVLCRQLTYNALSGTPASVAYFTSNKRPEFLLDQMESFSFHVHYHYVSDRFRIYSLNLINRNPFSDESIQLLLDCLNDLTDPFSLAIIDDINPLLANMTTDRQITVLRDIKSVCEKCRRTIIVVTNPYVCSRKSLSRMQSLCDYCLRTDIVAALPGLEQLDYRTMRTLEIRKRAGVEMTPGEIVRFEIRPGTGIHILPYVTVRA